jgi:hypothetical protein
MFSTKIIQTNAIIILMLIGADFTGEATSTGLSKVLKGIIIRTINYIYLPNPICIIRRRIFMFLPIKSRLCNVYYVQKRKGNLLRKGSGHGEGWVPEKEPKLSLFASVCVSADIS